MSPPAGTSTSALRSIVIWDVRLQFRYGFYAVYAVVTLFYLLVLGRLPGGLVEPALVLVLVTDTAVLGFYFVGALVLIEKREGVLDALVVSPLGVDGYLLSKTASLTALATLASTLVVGLVRPPGIDPLLLLAGVVPTASLFVLVGVAAVARFDTMNRYFFGALLYGVVLYAPLAGYLGLLETPLFYLLPVQPALVLVAGAFDTLAYLAFGNVAAYLIARGQFRRHVLQDARERPRTRDRTPGRLASWIGARVGPVGGRALADARN